MTRIASVNVNGIRAAARKGMADWIETSGVDILTIQEVRGQLEHLEAVLPGWHILEEESPQKGRAGVAIASRFPSSAHPTGLGGGVDGQRPWLEADFQIACRVVT